MADEYPDFFKSTGYGTGEGLCGWNCRHSFFPFYPGISQPHYTAEALAALNEKSVEYQGKKYTRYEISQMQRALERQVRAAKRKCMAEEAAGLDATAAAAELKAARQRLAAFVKDTGGKENGGRTLVPGFGKAQAEKSNEAVKGLTGAADGGTLGERQANGKAGDTDGSTTIDHVEEFDFTDSAAVKAVIHDFADRYSSAPIEHAVVMSPNGKLYRLTGTSGNVNTGVVGEEALKGSIGIHNHPVWEGFDRGDSFSLEDVRWTARYRTGTEYLVSGTRREKFTYTGNLTPDEMQVAYEEAQRQAGDAVLAQGGSLEFWQEATMRVLAKMVDEVEFDEQI